MAVNQGLSDLGSSTSAILQSSLAVLLDTLGVMLEIPPREARTDLEIVERAYREVSLALRNVYWDLSLAANDANVQNALANLSRSDNIRALDDLKDLIEKLCATALSAEAPLFPGDATTLPGPDPVVEPLDEYEYLFDDEPSAMASYGYLIASSRSVALTPTEAVCVGRTVTDVSQAAVFDDEQFEKVVEAAFGRCGVNGFESIVPTTVSE